MWCSCRLSVGKRPLEPRYLLTGSAMCNLPGLLGKLLLVVVVVVCAECAECNVILCSLHNIIGKLCYRGRAQNI